MVAVHDAATKAVIPGFEEDKCVITDADGPMLPLRWAGSTDIAGRLVTLRVYFRESVVYAIGTGNDTRLRTDDSSAAVRHRPIRIYPHAPNFSSHPLYFTKAVRPSEMQHFGRGSACAGKAGCTGFYAQLYTSQNVSSGAFPHGWNATAQLQDWLGVANIFTPSGQTLFAPNFSELARALADADVNSYSFSCEWAFRFMPGQGFDPYGYPAQCAPAQDPVAAANLKLAERIMGSLYLGQGVEEHDLPGCVGQYSQIQHGLFVAPGDRVAQHLAFMDCTQAFRDPQISAEVGWKSVDMNIGERARAASSNGIVRLTNLSVVGRHDVTLLRQVRRQFSPGNGDVGERQYADSLRVYEGSWAPVRRADMV